MSKKRVTTRVLLLTGFNLIIGLISRPSLADELSVIAVRNNIPMSDTDPAYQDFYVSGGDASGLKPNTILTAVRKINVQDATGTKNFGEIKIPVGELKVIYSNNKVAVARLTKLISRASSPVLDDSGVMIGDLIDISSTATSKTTSKTKN